MRPELPDPVRGTGWMPLDPARLGHGWPALVAPGFVGAFAPAAPEPASDVVDLASRRAPPATRPQPRRVPEADIVALARTAAPRPENPPVREDVLDLAEVASAPIPFPGPGRRKPGDRHRLILYLVGAAFILATGLVYSYRTARVAGGIAVPDAVLPGHVVT